MKLLRAVPLLLTCLRLLLGPTYIVASARQWRTETLILIVAVALLTDWLDGFLARRLKAVSATGKLLDPLADALFCMIVFFVFAYQGLMPSWIVAILIVREALITFVLRPVALWRGVVVEAQILGKIKTAVQFIAMLLVLAGPLAGPDPALTAVTWASLYAALFFSVASAAKYIWDGIAYELRRPRAGES